MLQLRSLLRALILLAAIGASGHAAAANDIQLVYNGVAAPNGAAPPATPAFDSWCAGVCFPTTRQTVNDPRSGRAKGEIFVWGKNFQYAENGSLCFSEFIVFALAPGEIHVASGDRGTCGAPVDAVLKPPLYPELGAQVVIAGGGDGLIVGGTGRYAHWSGSYTDRVFVGFGAPESGVGGIIYYDQLWFSISGGR